MKYHFYWHRIMYQLQNSIASQLRFSSLCGREPDKANTKQQTEFSGFCQLLLCSIRPGCLAWRFGGTLLHDQSPAQDALDPEQAQYLQDKDSPFFLSFFKQPWNYILAQGTKLPGPLVVHELACFMAPQASGLNVVLLSTISCMALNVWHKTVRELFVPACCQEAWIWAGYRLFRPY